MRFFILAGALMLLSSCGGEGENKAADAPVKVMSKGETMFRQNCATCHNPLRALTGPALKGALARWDNDTVRMKTFIRNPAKAIEAGDPRALAAFEEYKPTVMTAFPNLSGDDLDLIISYFEGAQ